MTGRRNFLIWTAACAVLVLLLIAVPVTEQRSLGLEGANQANIKTATEELTAGKLLEFRLESSADTAREIGFFFRTNGREYADGTLRIAAFDEEKLIGGKDYALSELKEDQFLFVKLDDAPERLTVRIACDAREAGPSVWLNETTRTPGTAVWFDGEDGQALEKSLVYNLIYTVNVHRVGRPVMVGLILFLFGLGICSAGAWGRSGRTISSGKKPAFPKPALRQLGALGLSVLLVALLFYYLYDTQIRIAQNTTEKSAVLSANGNLLAVSEEHAQLTQQVRPQEDRLTGFGVRFFVEPEAVLGAGHMHASVTDLTLGELLCETDIEAGQFISGEYVGLLFRDSQEGVKDHLYQIDLAFSEELWDSGLSVMESDGGLCVNAYLYFNIFLKRFFFFVFLGTELFVCLFWYLAFVKKSRIENVFLATVLFLGLLYNVLLTPQMAPDEAKHIDMAYRYSNELLGYEGIGDTKCLMRREDAETEFTSSPTMRNYRNIYEGLFSMAEDTAMVEAEVNSNIEGSFLFYAPAVLGMSLARLLGLGTVPMLLLARYLNLAVFAFLTYVGMRCLPFGKMTLFLLAVLPINIQQCTSFSHDAMVHGILFLYGCLCLEAIYGEKGMDRLQMLLLELSALFLVYCKSGSYLPLAFLPILIPADHYGGKKERQAGTLALLGIPVLAFLMKHMQTVAGIVGTTEATSVVSMEGARAAESAVYQTGYTLGYFLRDPLEFVYIMANTVFDKAGFYLESLVGYKLGWVELETSMVVVILFLFLLFLSVCDTRETVKILPFQRFWMAFLCLGCTGLILLGMLLQWTPMGYVSVEGVQGRYFLPFLLILLTACRNRLVMLARNIDRGLMTAAVTGQLLTVMYLIKQICQVPLK